MSRRRLAALGLGVAVLLVLAGIASHGRPLRGGRGRGPTPVFFDYVATTLVLAALVMLVVVVASMFTQPAGGGAPRRGRWHLVSGLVAIAGSVVLAYALIHTGFIQRVQELEKRLNKNQQSQGSTAPSQARGHGRNPHLRWDEIGIFIALIAGTAVVLYASKRTQRPPLRRLQIGRETRVALALDESIDDLRTDPDLRRAIIAAYARMEHALARAGLPRHPAEAPFEYLERALRTLDTSAASVQRLTDLFEWAKFSHHEPRPEMRDEAIDALVAVRDELARPAEPAVTA